MAVVERRAAGAWREGGETTEEVLETCDEFLRQKQQHAVHERGGEIKENRPLVGGLREDGPQRGRRGPEGIQERQQSTQRGCAGVQLQMSPTWFFTPHLVLLQL